MTSVTEWELLKEVEILTIARNAKAKGLSMVRHTKEDRDATKALRQMRVDEKRESKELNHVGKRVQWCRERLELRQNEVCAATGIPPSSYHGRECGVRTDFWEEMLLLAGFFSRSWKEKFQDSFPSYSGTEIKMITVSWLMFGSDDLVKDLELLIQEYQVMNAQRESDFFYKEAELKRQLTMAFEGEF